MNILSKIEKFERGIYSGAIGFIDEKQQANLAVVIRTLLIDDVNFEFQVGGAITFDSKADSELEEIYTKAQAIIKTLKIPDKLLKKLVN